MIGEQIIKLIIDVSYQTNRRGSKYHNKINYRLGVLIEYLHTECGFVYYVLTSKLNQDCLAVIFFIHQLLIWKNNINPKILNLICIPIK